jgi:hypothetical protein
MTACDRVDHLDSPATPDRRRPRLACLKYSRLSEFFLSAMTGMRFFRSAEALARRVADSRWGLRGSRNYTIGS